jgi:RNA polymerase-binding protein DksA
MRKEKKTTSKTARKSSRPTAKAKRTVAKVTKKVAVKKVAPVKVKKPTKPTVRREKVVFKKEELKYFRQQLEEERGRLKVELDEIEARAARALEVEAAGELSDYDDHPADMASETFEREKDLAIADNLAAQIAKIQTALNKLEVGTYGVCDICGRAIKRARLQAIPFATLCIDCQGRVEVR